MIPLLRIAAVVIASAVAAVWMIIQPVSAQSDVTPPVVAHLMISPTLVDTSHAVQTVTLTARITDNLSGLRYATIWFGPYIYGDEQDKPVTFSDWKLVNGDAVDGVYETTLTLPRFSADGRWVAKYMVMEDAVGNKARCNTDAEMECPQDWSGYYFVNIQDNRFLYLPYAYR
jgi:hypothetical protein